MAQREKRNKNRGSAGNNRKTGSEFLEKNRLKKEILETNSGLQYQIIESGNGTSPDENSIITIHQRCWVLNGHVLADTYKENTPVDAEMKDLIEGYREGIQLMNKESRFKFFISPELAWGKKGSGNKIPPNAVLIFDVRLIDFW